jgi:hypothetical protein
LGSKIDSTPKQTKSFKFFEKFTHLDSWVVTFSPTTENLVLEI